MGTDLRGQEIAKTFYVGGAGALGHVGTLDIPRGLRAAGYRGAVEAFGWQCALGGTLRDQLDYNRNREQARRLAHRIKQYHQAYPAGRINLIALSAGTGIVVWALESLPEDCHVGTVVFLGSSLSRQCNLSRALRRIDGHLYNFYTPTDPVLMHLVPVTGSIDRVSTGPSVAGLFGFACPDRATPQERMLYRLRLRNMPHREEYARCGYRGMHIDATKAPFVRQFLAPLLREELDPGTPSPPVACNPAILVSHLETAPTLTANSALRRKLRPDPAPEPR